MYFSKKVGGFSQLEANLRILWSTTLWLNFANVSISGKNGFKATGCFLFVTSRFTGGALISLNVEAFSHIDSLL